MIQVLFELTKIHYFILQMWKIWGNLQFRIIKSLRITQTESVSEVLLLFKWLLCICRKFPAPCELPYLNSDTPYQNSDTPYQNSDTLRVHAAFECACFEPVISGHCGLRACVLCLRWKTKQQGDKWNLYDGFCKYSWLFLKWKLWNKL